MQRAAMKWSLGILLFFVGCASYTEEVAQIDNLYRSQQYDKALKEIDSSALKEQTRNRLLYHLERAMILDRKGEYKEARKAFLDADRAADELYTVSISKVAASFIYNDSATEYAGEDYEVVQIHTMLALSFLEEKSYKEARVEAVKINNKLLEINSRYDERSKNQYATDAFALYLSGMIFEKLGEADDAIIDYRKSLATYEDGFKSFYRGGVQEDLVVALASLYHQRNRRDELKALKEQYKSILGKIDLESLTKKAQIIAVHDMGQIAPKEQENFVLPIAGQIVRFSFPVIKQRQYSSSGQTGLHIQSLDKNNKEAEKFHRSQNYIDLDAIAHQSLEDKRLRYTLKAGARLLIKGQVTVQAERQFGDAGKLAGMLYSAITETADTRSWSLLPGAFNVSRAWVEPGRYQVSAKTEGDKEKAEAITLKPGEIYIIRAK